MRRPTSQWYVTAFISITVAGFLSVSCTQPSPAGISMSTEEYQRFITQEGEIKGLQNEISRLNDKAAPLEQKIRTLEAENQDLKLENARLKASVDSTPKPSVPTPAPATAATSTPSVPTPTPSQYLINQEVIVNNVAKWTVLEAKDWGDTLPASKYRYSFGAKPRVTSGKFIEVSFKVENMNTKPETWPGTPKVVDNRKREFSPAESYYEYIPEGKDFLGVTLQPGLPIQATIIYEIPKDAAELSLKVHDFGFLSPKTALIGLGL